MSMMSILIRLAVAAALLAGCAARAEVTQPTGKAYVDVDRLLPQHPFYSQLRHYDEQIAALQATGADRGPLSNEALARDIQHLQQELNAAAASMRSVTVQNTGRYDSQRRTAIERIFSTPVAANSSNDGAVADAMLRTYRDQQGALRNGAARDMERYGRDLSAQQNEAYRAYVSGVEARLARAYAMRAQELQEQEGTLALDISRKNMEKRLALQVRLRTLAMNSERRHEVAQQLHAIDAQEAAIVGTQRRRDLATLFGYRTTLESQGRADIAQMAQTLQGRSRANIADRRRIYVAQTRSASADLPVHNMPQNGPAIGARSLLTRMQYDDPGRRAAATIDAFSGAGNDMLGRLGATRNADADAQRDANSELVALKSERDTLHAQMREQILRVANNVAHERGLQMSTAHAGVTDLTGAVADRLRAFDV